MIKLTLKIHDKKSGQKESINCIITSGKMLTRYSDINRAYRAYSGLREQEGKDGYHVEIIRGIIKEIFKGKSEEEIADNAEKQMEAMQIQIDKESNFKYKYTRD